MAEESGKGIALVILGIVAIIALVGLVLMFTGNGATGEFAVPGAKAYGGAIKGVADPYSHAFAGRAGYFEAGTVPEFTSSGEDTRSGANVAYGDNPQIGGAQSATSGEDVLPQSFVNFQALHASADGMVQPGDQCNYDPMQIAGLAYTSDQNYCARQKQLGKAVDSLMVYCNGKKSKASVASSGYGTQGMGSVYRDVAFFPVSDVTGKACYYVFDGVQPTG